MSAQETLLPIELHNLNRVVTELRSEKEGWSLRVCVCVCVVCVVCV
jgi:hypothetical protein